MKNLLKICVVLLLISCNSDENRPFIPENYEWQTFTLNFESSGEKDITGSNLTRGIIATYQGFGQWNLNLHSGSTTAVINDTLFLVRGNTYRYSTLSYAKEFPSGKIVDMHSIIYQRHELYQFFFLGDAFLGDKAPLKFEYGDSNGKRIGLNGLLSIKADAKPDTVNFSLILRANLNKGFPGTADPHMVEPSFAGGIERMNLSFPVVIK
ncbi:MAG: hypothetical protein Q8S14_01315 [Algoriphagus sp.]|uniref:hypothetical protein n=1 Tax=Algoriphagus sp. TaxID=1872435 RepID=UPI002718D57C|nr:hypothetical protein [Algoriphagus sp.]MDO8965846.1 hypothetical protein [Algoriphagus sp.]MDP2042142.1 hypothetical protein [Algoriphagus sp.]MDP3201102.1 hypothetical protein [Algoriphagus sp.]MDP3470483.1 hypothetical protein [Algoriphagus sp.]